MKLNYKSSDNEDDNYNISDVSKVCSDKNSSFDFAQLDLDLKDVLQELEEKDTENTEEYLKCTQCEYKCKRQNTLKKHMNTKHGANRR